MDVVEVLRRASDVVDRAGVAGDLRSVAFSTAVELILKGTGSLLPAAEPGADDLRRFAEARGDQGSDLGGDARDDAGPDPVDDAPSAPLRRLGAVPSSSTAAHRSSAAPRVAARVEVGGRGVRGDRLVAVGPPRGPTGVADEPWGHIADALGVRPELLDRVWEERGGRLQLAGDPARLGRTRAQRVGTAAVLLLAALRWSGRDGGEPVPDAVVRAEVERLGLLDTGNYTKHLAGRRQLLSTTGSGRTATYKLRYDGLEEARAIAQALLEDS